MIEKSVLGKYKIVLPLYLIPFIVVCLFVANFSVNVPFWDQWELVDLFEKVATSKASFIDFFTQHNEHRLFFPKLIFVSIAFLSKWNVKYELCFSIFLASVNFLVLYKLSTLQNKKQRGISWHLSNILTCALVFSIAQYENWLWGFQIAWFLINTCLLIAVLIIAISSSNPKRFYLAAIPCFIASFSSAHGLLTWLAVIPSVICINGSLKQRITRTITWILLFFSAYAVYSIGYHKPGLHPDTLFFLKEPLIALNYFFTLLGTPLKSKIITGYIVGCILLFVFLYLTAYFVRKSKPKFQIDSEAAAWISIGLFAILFALMTTVGRAGFGVEQAMSSRYTTSAVLLIISTAQLWRLLFWNNSFLTGMVMSILLINSVDAIPQANTLQLQRQRGATCLELVNYMDGTADNSCMGHLYPSAASVKERAKILEKIGFRKFPSDIEFIDRPIKEHGYIDAPLTGDFLSISKNSNLKMAGWAIIPDSQAQPKVVLFSYGNRKFFFASTLVNLDSPDVAKAFNSSRYHKARWLVDISLKNLPLGTTAIAAWVYNPASQQFIRLRGEPKLTVLN